MQDLWHLLAISKYGDFIVNLALKRTFKWLALNNSNSYEKSIKNAKKIEMSNLKKQMNLNMYQNKTRYSNN